jgi:hypothetical protein
MKKLYLLLALITSASLGYCGWLPGAAASTFIPVISSQTIKGTCFSTATPLNVTDYKAFSYILDVAGTAPDVKLEYYISSYEGSSISTTTAVTMMGANVIGKWISPATNGTLDSSVTADQADWFSIPATKWVHFRVTGVNANSYNTKVTLYIGVYSEK